MKKFLLSLVALLGVMNVNAQVTTTDVSGYEYAIYAEDINACTGTNAILPICLKNAETVASFQFSIVLPGELADNAKKQGLNENRFAEDNGGTVYDFNKQSDGSVMVVATVIHDDGFNVGDDAICYIQLSIPATMALGEYPIVIKATELSGIGGVATKSEKITEEITSKLIINDYVLLDEESTSVPLAAENVTVKVKRTINAGEWSTICLPIDMFASDVERVFGEGSVFARFKDYTKDGGQASSKESMTAENINLNFQSWDWADPANDGLYSNTPYLVKSKNDVEEFTVEGATIIPEAVDVEYNNGKEGSRKVVYGHFYGTQYAGQKIPENGLFLSGGNFWYSKGLTKIKGFRGYFVLNDVLADLSASSVKMQITVDGEPTGVNGIDFVTAPEGVFTIDGKKMNNDATKLQKGVYIIDGKKVAIK